MIAETIFWIAIGCVFYAYVGYFALLFILSIFYNKSISTRPMTPEMTMIISAYNEEDIIEEKIKNTLALNYPKNQLEIIIVSDASSDGTERIAKRYSGQGIKTKRFEGRIGKTACLNLIIPETRGKIIVLSDANSNYHHDALLNIAKNFADTEVGCVTGWTHYTSIGGDREIESLGLYARMEKSIKILENHIGSCVGADGAIFSIRKELYHPLKPHDINDFVIPLNVISKGYRTIFEKDAICFEEAAHDLHGEFNRQVRITNRTIRALWNNRHLFNILRYKIFSIQLISHKLLKFMTPFLLILSVLSNIIIFSQNAFYIALLFLQIGFYAFSLFPASFFNATPFSKLHSFCQTFLFMNFALATGWFTFFSGKNFVTWQSSR